MSAAPAEIKLVLSFAAKPGSLGWRMHNAGYKALGLPYVYLPRKYVGDIAVALEAVRALGVRGVSLTMPFKQACLPYLQGMSETAREVGAVNTVLNDDGVLTGHNTDAPAAEALIAAHLPWRECPLLILGAGGMACAFAQAARSLGAKAVVSARNDARARELAERFGHGVREWGAAAEGMIVCNATPVGMPGVEGAVDARGAAGVFDAVFNPAGTALAAGGVPTVSGEMLALEQACLQFTLYTGESAPRTVMQEAMHG